MKFLIFIILGMFLSSGFLCGESLFCGKAKVVSGSRCSNLRVRFILSECGDGDEWTGEEEGKVLCQKGGAVAQLSKGKKIFSIAVREISPGVWSPVGNVYQLAQQAPDTNLRSRQSSLERSAGSSLVDFGGEFRFRTEKNQNNDFSTIRSFHSLRLRPEISVQPADLVRFYFEPQVTHVFGEPKWIPVTETHHVKVGTSGSQFDPGLTVHQAFGDLSLTSFWRVILGRQEFSYGEQVLVGASDWENPGTSFDGIRSRFEWEKSFLEIFTAKLWDSNATSNGTGDQDFHGIYFSWSHPQLLMALEPYSFWLNDQRGDPFQVFTTGLFLKGQLNRLRFRSELSGQWGDRTGQQAWLALNAPPIFREKISLGVDAFWSSPQFNSLFPTSHLWLGWADVLGRRNLSGGGFTAEIDSGSALDFHLRLLYFIRSDTRAPSYQWDGLTSINLSEEEGAYLGWEADLGFKLKIHGSADILASAALFFPSPPLKRLVSADGTGRFEISVMSRF